MWCKMCQEDTRYHGVELGQVRSAVVNKLVGVEFNVINVACILFFRTISIRTKIWPKPINTENITKRF